MLMKILLIRKEAKTSHYRALDENLHIQNCPRSIPGNLAITECKASDWTEFLILSCSDSAFKTFRTCDYLLTY